MTRKQSTGEDTMPRRAVSYERVSKAKPGGDSLDRQGDFAAETCQKHGWVLDDTFRFSDKSKSAYSRKNRSPTADLTRFLNAIRSGDIQPGTVLVIERIDRLTRDKVSEAQRLWHDILDAGVWIATRCPERVYTGPPEDLNELLEPVFLMYLAHEESRKKSLCANRQWSNARKAARASNTPHHVRPPAWIERVDGAFRLDPERALEVKKMTSLVITNGVGTVAAIMNEQGLTGLTRSRRWTGATVRQLLVSRTLLGEYQPTITVEGRRVPDGPPIAGYYPAVLTVEEYDQAVAALQRRRRSAGRPAAAGRVNVLRGLVEDTLSRCRMSLQTTMKRGVARSYLSVGKATGCLRVRYNVVLECVLDTVRQLRPIDVLPPGQTQTAHEERAAELSARLGRLKQKQAELQAALSNPDLDTSSILAALSAVKADLSATGEEHKRAHWLARSGRADALASAQTLVEERDGKTGEALSELDGRIQAALPTVIRRIDVAAERVSREVQVVTLTIHLLNGGTRVVEIDPRLPV